MTTRYTFTLATRDSDQLHDELAALSAVPGLVGLSGSGDTVEVLYSESLSPTQYAAVYQCVMTHVPDPIKRAQRVAAQAIAVLMTDPDPRIRGLVALVRLDFTLGNDVRELLGLPRILEPEIIQRAAALLVAEQTQGA